MMIIRTYGKASIKGNCWDLYFIVVKCNLRVNVYGDEIGLRFM